MMRLVLRRFPSALILLAMLLGIAGSAVPLAGAVQSQVRFSQSGDLENRLRLAGPLQLPTLDPALVKDLQSMFLVRQLFTGLMRFDSNLDPIPAMAESVDISDDGLVYRFVLREDARFFSGEPITADDVVFSLTRTLDPATAGGDVSALAGPTFLADILGAPQLLAGESSRLEGLSIIDERTIDIRLSQPRSTFLMRLAATPASIVDSGDMSLGATWWTAPNASGPFAIREMVDNSHILLEPNPHHAPGVPSLDEVEIRIGNGAFGALNLYETNEIDVAGVDYFNIERIIDPANPVSAELHVAPLFSVEYVAFRTDSEPLSDPKIRQALLAAYPVERLANVTFNGRVEAAEGIIPDGMLGVGEWPVDHPYDVERARSLIRESSYGEAENVPPIAIYTAVPNRAESLRDVLEAELGLTVEVIVVDWQSYLAGLANREYPAYLLYWGADYPDPESMLLTLFGSDRADNYVDYRNAQFDGLLDQASREQDPEQRIVLYEQANQLLIDDAVVLPLYFDVAYTLVKPWVQGLDVTPIGLLYLDAVSIER